MKRSDKLELAIALVNKAHYKDNVLSVFKSQYYDKYQLLSIVLISMNKSEIKKCMSHNIEFYLECCGESEELYLHLDGKFYRKLYTNMFMLIKDCYKRTPKWN